MSLWEVLVPTVRNNGKPYHTRYHRVWDAKIRKISGGLTILSAAKGQWIHQNSLYSERMIPVRIIATRKEIDSFVIPLIEYNATPYVNIRAVGAS